MTIAFRFVIRGAVLAVVSAGCAGLLSGSVLAQGIGMPGMGMPGVGNPAMNLPQRQGPMVGGGAGGVPGQMNPRIGGAGMRPGVGVGMPAPNMGGSRGAAFAGVPQSAAGFSGMARGMGGAGMTGQNMSNMNRNVVVPGIGNVGGRR
jgi:hypothetical protein